MWAQVPIGKEFCDPLVMSVKGMTMEELRPVCYLPRFLRGRIDDKEDYQLFKLERTLDSVEDLVVFSLSVMYFSVVTKNTMFRLDV